jgi:hypothetical protein
MLNIMEANNMISVIVSSRELDRKNPGNLTKFLSSIKSSISNPNNIEIIFKFDNDDFLIENSLIEAATANPELNVKYFFSDRYGYLGLHKAYYECLDLLDPKSYVIVILADDFLCTPGSNWDKQLLEVSIDFKNEPFLIQDPSKLGQMHDIPIFSRKIIDLVTLGDSLSVDSWSMSLYSIYSELSLTKYILSLPEFTTRQLCAFDMSYERWNVEREKLIKYLESQDYKDLIEKSKNKIKEYFKL